VEFYDEELDWEVCRQVGINTHPSIADTRTGNIPAEKMLRVTCETVSQLIRDRILPFNLMRSPSRVMFGFTLPTDL
jgi:hypothetical protein